MALEMGASIIGSGIDFVKEYSWMAYNVYKLYHGEERKTNPSLWQDRDRRVDWVPLQKFLCLVYHFPIPSLIYIVLALLMLILLNTLLFDLFAKEYWVSKFKFEALIDLDLIDLLLYLGFVE